VIGAIVASLAAAFLLGHGSSPGTSTVTAAQVMLAEALGTFALVNTALNVATASDNAVIRRNLQELDAAMSPRNG